MNLSEYSVHSSGGQPRTEKLQMPLIHNIVVLAACYA